MVGGNFTGESIFEVVPFLGGMVTAGFFALAVALIVIFSIVVYIYTSLAWYTIGRKLKYKKAWLAWIPIANFAMILEMGGFHWAWVFLILIPILGWIALGVLLIIACWKIFEKRNYPGWFCLVSLIPEVGGILAMIIIGFVAWKDLKKKLFS